MRLDGILTPTFDVCANWWYKGWKNPGFCKISKPHSREYLTMRQGLVDFSRKLREWDGFGVNYVELAQSRTLRDYRADPQDYGGFSTLSEADRRAIIDMTLVDGLARLVKMFLDPFHQSRVSVTTGTKGHHKNAYDHWDYSLDALLCSRGSARTARGDDLTMCHLYSPPA
jgi:hypothetical protein